MLQRYENINGGTVTCPLMPFVLSRLYLELYALYIKIYTGMYYISKYKGHWPIRRVLYLRHVNRKYLYFTLSK